MTSRRSIVTRYVSELVDAVSETRKTKDRDCGALAGVCGALHSGGPSLARFRRN